MGSQGEPIAYYYADTWKKSEVSFTSAVPCQNKKVTICFACSAYLRTLTPKKRLVKKYLKNIKSIKSKIRKVLLQASR